MLELEQVMMHVINTANKQLVISEKASDPYLAMIKKLMSSKIEKTFRSGARVEAPLNQASELYPLLQDYEQHQDFHLLSTKIAQYLYDLRLEHNQYEKVILCCALIIKDERRYLFVLENYCQSALSYVMQDDLALELVAYDDILSPSMHKNDHAFLLELSNHQLCILEKKTTLNDQLRGWFSDIVLKCEYMVSYDACVDTMKEISTQISEKYELPILEVMPTLKSTIVEKTKMCQPLEIDEIADTVFGDVPQAKEEFTQQLAQARIPKQVDVEYAKASRKNQVHRIKTDNGIEIVIPVDYMNMQEYFEIVPQEDGSISLILKNIMHYSSR
ncbi:MAG: nucleoid-associated protein [Longicatena sp.]|nr:nucleoid-associated protein [Longicatena sp.]